MAINKFTWSFVSGELEINASEIEDENARVLLYEYFGFPKGALDDPSEKIRARAREARQNLYKREWLEETNTTR